MTLLSALRVPLFERLRDDGVLATLLTGGIYERLAASDVQKPYVRIGSPTEISSDTLGCDGWQDTVTLDVFCSGLVGNAYVGYGEPYQILDAVHAALKDPLLLDGYGMIALRHEFTGLLSEDEGKTIHVVMRYRLFALAAL